MDGDIALRGSVVRPAYVTDPYDVLRIGRENERVLARKYTELAELQPDGPTKDRLLVYVSIHQRGVEDYTRLLNERGIE